MSKSGFWQKVRKAASVTLILVGFIVVVAWQLSKADTVDLLLAMMIPAVVLFIWAVLTLDWIVASWALNQANRNPDSVEAAGYDEGEGREAFVRSIAHKTQGCLPGAVLTLLWLPLLLSPGLAALLTTVGQCGRAEQRAITEVYSEAAYASGLRMARRGNLNNGQPADPAALSIYKRRSFIPPAGAFVLTLITADWLLRRYYGSGYSGSSRPLIDLAALRDDLVQWWQGVDTLVRSPPSQDDQLTVSNAPPARSIPGNSTRRRAAGSTTRA